MKTWMKVVLGIAGGFAALIGLIFWLTGDVTKAGDDFFATKLQERKKTSEREVRSLGLLLCYNIEIKTDQKKKSNEEEEWEKEEGEGESIFFRL